MTLFREPRARVAASFERCRAAPSDQQCNTHLLDARNATFAQWVEHQGNQYASQLLFDVQFAITPRDQQTKFMQLTASSRQITGQFHTNLLHLVERERHKFAPLSQADVDETARALDGWFAAVGLVERLDESLELFERATGVGFVAGRARPVAPPA